MDDVAGIHLAQPDATANRRSNASISKLQSGIVDSALVRLDRTLVLPHQCLLRIDLLFRDRILCEQHLVAFEVDMRILE